MDKDFNKPQQNDDDCINKCRAAIHHRGLWMGLLLQKMKETGVDWEGIGRKAIEECGCIHGQGIYERMTDKDSLVNFGETFFTDHVKKIFEIEVTQSDENSLKLEYHHCPMVTAWMDMGLEGEFLDKVCDVAMCGDRGISTKFPQFRFELGKTLAQGHPICEVAFHRRK